MKKGDKCSWRDPVLYYMQPKFRINRKTGLEIVSGGPKFYTHTHTHTNTRARTHTHTHSHTLTHPHSLTHSLTHIRTRAQAHTHARTHAHTHTNHTHTNNTHARTYERTHAHTHTHTRRGPFYKYFFCVNAETRLKNYQRRSKIGIFHYSPPRYLKFQTKCNLR